MHINTCISLFVLKIIFKRNNGYKAHLTNLETNIFITIKEYYKNKHFPDFLNPLIKTTRTKQKHIITAHRPKLLLKQYYFFYRI